MAKKKENAPAQAEADKQDTLQRPPPKRCTPRKWPGWRRLRSRNRGRWAGDFPPGAVLSFILGDTELGIAPKFVGRRASWSGRSSPWPPTAG